MTDNEKKNLTCPICQYATDQPDPQDLGQVKGNTERFRHQLFSLWKCPQCQTIVSLSPVDFYDIYKDYPLNQRQLDVFAKGTLKNLLSRLSKAGMKKTDYILDFGCGNGIFVDYLTQQGYCNTVGYDPYVAEFSQKPAASEIFDVVINNDTLEHGDDYYQMIGQCLDWLKPGGLLYLGTADSEPVQMNDLEPHVMRLHQPYHRIIVTEKSLHQIIKQFDVDWIAQYSRSYHDTLRPFSNYRFLDELNKAVGHNLDKAMDEKITTSVFLRTPRLWFFALWGYFFPSAKEPAVIVRKKYHDVQK